MRFRVYWGLLFSVLIPLRAEALTFGACLQDELIEHDDRQTVARQLIQDHPEQRRGLRLLAIHPDLTGMRFMHGTRALTIQSASKTENTLYPTGHLLKVKKMPLVGEADVGISANGINQVRISGTVPGDDRAIKYARSPANIYHPEDPILLAQPGAWKFTQGGAHAAAAILSSRIERSKIYDFDYYKRNVMRELNRLLKQAQKAHPEARLEIKKIRSELKKPPARKLTELERELANIPVVVGSRTLRPDDFTFVGGRHEAVVSKAKFGLDLQYVFTETKHIDKVRSVLKANGMNGVTVMSMDALEALQILAIKTVRREGGRYLLDDANEAAMRSMVRALATQFGIKHK